MHINIIHIKLLHGIKRCQLDEEKLTAKLVVNSPPLEALKVSELVKKTREEDTLPSFILFLNRL